MKSAENGNSSRTVLDAVVPRSRTITRTKKLRAMLYSFPFSPFSPFTGLQWHQLYHDHAADIDLGPPHTNPRPCTYGWRTPVMRKLISFAIAVLGLLACQSSASAQTYDWNGGPYNQDANYASRSMRLTVNALVTTVNVTASHPESQDTVDTYTLASGPAPQVGEWAQVGGAMRGRFQIVDLGTDANGNPTMTLAEWTDWSVPNSGTATIGPALAYSLYFNGPNGQGVGPTATCDPANSSITAGFLDSNGNLQSAPSGSGTVTCSNSTPDRGITIITTGTFSGTASNGLAFTATFTITNKRGRYGLNAQSVQWTL